MKRCIKGFCVLFSTLLLIILPSCQPVPKVVSQPSTIEGAYTINTVPDFSDEPFVEINHNIPYFTEREYKTEAYEDYSKLDKLGRCGVASACVCRETMPTEKRGNISHIKPTGWQSIQYDFVDGKSLYNRCHLIGFQLTAENANNRNLITGTRYMNTEGMLPFENMVADYVKETKNHVMYRVTPVFDGNNLVARGVEMEAYSVEDSGEGVSFNVYVYNNQPGVTINYADGTSKITEDESTEGSGKSQTVPEASAKAEYVINTNNQKIHLPDCSSVKTMKEKNKKTVKATLKELIQQGYTPCGTCLSQK